jgi:prevent-host-death family protein
MHSVEMASNPSLNDLVQQTLGGDPIVITEAGEQKAVILSAKAFSGLIRNYEYRQQPLHPHIAN